jgi:hypothetical protein
LLSIYKSAIFALANGAVYFDEFFFHKVILILTASFVLLFLRLTIDSHYPKSSFGNKNALRVFVCSDCGLPDKTILGHYTHCWKIEVMFKQQKMYMGLKSFMVRSAKAIDRLLIILPLAHFFFAFLSSFLLPLGQAIRRFRALLCTF